MSERRRLPNRRASESFEIESQGLRFTATISRFADGSLAEIFLQNHKAGSLASINAQDAAVLASIALQYGVPLEVISKALMRDAHGRASGPLATALDAIPQGESSGGAPCAARNWRARSRKPSRLTGSLMAISSKPMSRREQS
jgi:hypothetical protein